MPDEAPRCPMCGTVMTGESRPPDLDDPGAIREQLGGLERRIDDVTGGDVSPRQIKDESLWMCPLCQRIAGDIDGRDPGALEQRIRDEIQQLDRRLARLERRAG
jgi:hypothetical protein